MVETSTINSSFFHRKFAIHRLNVHLPASQKKYRWFVYVCEDISCGLTYVGSTVDVCSRWAQTKKACLDKNSNNTGLYKHFMEVWPAINNVGGELSHLRWTLVDHIDTSEVKRANAWHQGEKIKFKSWKINQKFEIFWKYIENKADWKVP